MHLAILDTFQVIAVGLYPIEVLWIECEALTSQAIGVQSTVWSHCYILWRNVPPQIVESLTQVEFQIHKNVATASWGRRRSLESFTSEVLSV